MMTSTCSNQQIGRGHDNTFSPGAFCQIRSKNPDIRINWQQTQYRIKLAEHFVIAFSSRTISKLQLDHGTPTSFTLVTHPWWQARQLDVATKSSWIDSLSDRL